MNTQRIFYLLGLSFVLLLTGCVIRTYPLTRDRVDQDLSAGNRGYLQGEAPVLEEKERKTTRTTQVIEVELHSPIRFEKEPKKALEEKERPLIKRIEDKELWGNRGYITQGQVSQVSAEPSPTKVWERYTVQKGDTLQKIAKKIYGTSKKWSQIYEANKDTLKSPDKIYPGQVIKIPVESLKEPEENLK